MNYLAHILLSGSDPEIKIGGLLGDFVKGPLQGELPRRIEQGIALHRAIDSWFDHQPEFIAARARFTTPFRRFAGIAIDLSYDHLLARRWQHHHHQPLAHFCGEFYEQLRSYYAQLPRRAQKFADHAPRIELLESYAASGAIEQALARISLRFRRPVDLTEGMPQIERQLAAMETEFQQLWPRAEQFASEKRRQLDGR
ncbi:ACP phosphodiesterase [Porticoccus sp. W117]|uniref:acyl carrier protein phosphodiesterase n=1 Tax=Porticoccus sp. W117 TaxID=3054777 RepID=UPI00259606D5|nr:ACP phosphodiesterase [Porticoccus sp. W117]MDM3870436.1 ACP phosphodiesterase [Porticoccus sp. W117]